MGLEPIFREGFEYECSIFAELSIDGNLAIVTKDRSSLFSHQQPFKISPTTGRKIKNWLETGVDNLEESQKLLNSLIKIINKINDIKDLAILWEEMKFQFKDLESDHLDLLIQTKDAKKEILSQPKKEKGSKVTPINKAKKKANASKNSKSQSAV